MIGIFGGAFDPVHHGHLRIALDVLEALNLERIHLVPLYQSVHKKQPIADAEHRFNMLQQAIKHQKGLVADNCEIRRGGRSYMVDTLELFQQSWPDQALCLLLGSDAYHGFSHWRQPQKILQLANIVVMQRPGYLPNEATKSRKTSQQATCHQIDDLKKSRAGAIHHQTVTGLQISSSHIRQRLSRRQSVDYLLPSRVISYIKQRNLY